VVFKTGFVQEPLVVFGLHAKAMGISQEQFLGFVESMTHRKRSTTLEEVANVAAT
jgi:hypothetical protein